MSQKDSKKVSKKSQKQDNQKQVQDEKKKMNFMTQQEKEELESAENIDDQEDEQFDEEEGEFDMYGDEDGEFQLNDDEEGESEGDFDETESEPEHSKTKNSKSKKKELNKDLKNTLLYDILGIKQDASSVEIKKAYHKMALEKHPDKNNQSEESIKNFQKLQKAYEVLSNPKKRERYDQWGDDGTDTFNSKEWMNAYEYYRSVHPEIQKDEVQDFEKKYRQSQEEKDDLTKFYKEFKGDMRKLLQHIMCSKNDDIPRFIQFFEDQIEQKVLEKTAKFDSTKSKIIKLPEEEKEAEQLAQNIKKAKENKQKNAPQSMEELQKMILQKRENAFGGFLNYVQEKYGGETQSENTNSKNASKKRKIDQLNFEKEPSKSISKKKKFNDDENN